MAYLDRFADHQHNLPRAGLATEASLHKTRSPQAGHPVNVGQRYSCVALYRQIDLDFTEIDLEPIAYLRDVLQFRPDLFAGPVPDGAMRGIDFYSMTDLLHSLAGGLKVFHESHRRLPDLVTLPNTADHFFKMKFFDPIPLSPNPASKLNAAPFVPAEARSRIRIPNRPWVSNRPILPRDSDVAPGTYWLKLDLGNDRNIKIQWPPSPEQRTSLERTVRQWFSRRYGVPWGEWWYGIGEQRIFLEEDFSEITANGSELKVFVRRGSPVLCSASEPQKLAGAKTSRKISYYDRAGAPLAGQLSLGVDGEKFANSSGMESGDIARCTDLAASIGRNFDLIRVDFFPRNNDLPVLGELTICSGNANWVFHPASFEDEVRRRLFE